MGIARTSAVERGQLFDEHNKCVKCNLPEGFESNSRTVPLCGHDGHHTVSRPERSCTENALAPRHWESVTRRSHSQGLQRQRARQGDRRAPWQPVRIRP